MKEPDKVDNRTLTNKPRAVVRKRSAVTNPSLDAAAGDLQPGLFFIHKERMQSWFESPQLHDRGFWRYALLRAYAPSPSEVPEESQAAENAGLYLHWGAVLVLLAGEGRDFRSAADGRQPGPDVEQVLGTAREP